MVFLRPGGSESAFLCLLCEKFAQQTKKRKIHQKSQKLKTKPKQNKTNKKIHKTPQKNPKKKSSKQMSAKTDIYLRLLQHESLCVFLVKVCGQL